MVKFRFASFLLWSCIIISVAWPAQAQTTVSRLPKADPLNTVLLQGFTWLSSKSTSSWYNVLKGIVDDAADFGITDVWFPPASHAFGPEGYLPGRLYDLNSSKYGSEQELRDALDAFHQKGIGCVGDMVLNHRCGATTCGGNACPDENVTCCPDENVTWCEFEGGTADGRLDWGPWAVVLNDKPCACGSGNNDTGFGWDGAPDIDHANPTIRADLSEWMNWLKSDVGFDGWRFDFVRGYAGSLLGEYIKNTDPRFAVGEFWDKMAYNASDKRLLYDQDAHRQRIVTWVRSTGTEQALAFDITTKGILQEAVKSNELWRLKDSNEKPAGMIGVLPQKAVTFIDNHDTGPNQQENSWPFPTDKLPLGYAYILTHPGVPSIFYAHFVDMDLKEQIRNLTAIRKRHNINANSSCRIITAEDDLYMAAIDEKIVMKIGARYDVGKFLPPSPEFSIAVSGVDYCVWEKSSSSGE